MKGRRKVIGLIRVSTVAAAADDRGGLPRQLEVIQHTLKAQDLDCVETVALKGVSGTDVRGTKEIQRLLEMIGDREIDGLVVADLDRLIRPAAGEDFAILDPFIQAKATIYANGQQFDFSNPTSTFVVKLLLSVAEFERTMILNRSRGAVRELCRAGRHPFGMHQLPRGINYDRESNTWSTNDQVTQVAEAFRLADDGIQNIAEIARKVGIHQRALHNLIRNPLYSGYRLYATGREPKKSVSRNGRSYKKKVPLPAEDVIKVRVLDPAPVTQDRFDRVQAMLAATHQAWKAERADRPGYNILLSVARCGRCGARLYFSQDRRRPNTGGYYFCSQHYYRKGKKGTCGAGNQSKAALDKATLSFISEHLPSSEAIRAIVVHSTAVTEANRVQPELKVTDPATFELRRKRLKDGFEAGVISVADLRERLAKIQEEEDATRRVAESQAKVVAAPQIELLIRKVVKGARAFRKLDDPSWRLRLIRRLFSQVHYENGQIIKVKFHPSLLGDDSRGEVLAQQVGAILANLTFTLLEPYPRRPNEHGVISPGKRLCPGCEKIKPDSAFWSGRTRCKACLGASNRKAYVRRLGITDRRPTKKSKFDSAKAPPS